MAAKKRRKHRTEPEQRTKSFCAFCAFSRLKNKKQELRTNQVSLRDDPRGES
jgi:hypothetical protein